MHPHTSNDDCLRDVCDGDYVINHVLFGKDPTALQVIAYYDDIEVVNPLGSKRKNHKLGKTVHGI